MITYRDLYDVTPHDTNLIPIDPEAQAGIIVGAAGTVVVDTPMGTTRTITFTETGIPGMFPLQVTRVKTASTATGIQILRK